MSTPCIDVLHADDHLVVVHKPSGLPSVPGRPLHLRDCAARQAQARFPDALIVHRLDMDTSGLLVLGRGAQAQRRLSQAFADRRVDKRYEALVWGTLAAAEGTIDLPLLTDWPHRPRQKIDPVLGKPSLTRFERLGHEGAHSRVALHPLTGRSHQLRVHLAAVGHCILGDALYAHTAARRAAPRLCLHASALRLPHPVTGATLSFSSPAPF